MGESQRANMMSQRVFIIALIALIASFCVALPTTDLVVPEAKDAGTSGAEFVQSTLKSGGTETQCRTFATDTISSINSGVTSEQGTATASHVADWKQAHEVLCALDQTTTCTVPTCPAVTQPTLANGVAAENCAAGYTEKYANRWPHCSNVACPGQ